jgi:hypothetical protein
LEIAIFSSSKVVIPRIEATNAAGIIAMRTGTTEETIDVQ